MLAESSTKTHTKCPGSSRCVSCVNALSTSLRAEVHRGGKVYEQEYARGKEQYAVREIGTTDKRGTTVEFQPDHEIFETLVYSYDTLADRMRELSYLNQGITITMTDERQTDEEGNHPRDVPQHRRTQGLRDLPRRNREAIIQHVIHMSGERNGVPVRSP